MAKTKLRRLYNSDNLKDKKLKCTVYITFNTYFDVTILGVCHVNVCIADCQGGSSSYSQPAAECQHAGR